MDDQMRFLADVAVEAARSRGRGSFLVVEVAVDLIETLADRVPGSTFVYVQPDASELRRLEALPRALRERVVLANEVFDGGSPSATANVAILAPKRYDPGPLPPWQLRLARAMLLPGSVSLVLAEKSAAGRSLLRTLADATGKGFHEVRKLRGAMIVSQPVDTPDSGTAVPSLLTESTFEVLGRRFDMQTSVGGFAPAGLDRGTRFLIENGLSDDAASVLDVACGWGAIGLAAAAVHEEATVTMFDRDLRSVAAARRNALRAGSAARVRVLHSDRVRDVDGTFGLVLSNPPLHVPAATLRDLLAGVAARTRPDGRALFVVQSGYAGSLQTILETEYPMVVTIGSDSGYVLLEGRTRAPA